MTLEVFAKHDRAGFIPPGKAANGLAPFNSQNLDVHQMLPSQPKIPKIAAA
tara:strand:- start:541 stop:693 length:153 start_codon:yes stop_codon:yes gene_type:complete